jgi:hypothetical protein
MFAKGKLWGTGLLVVCFFGGMCVSEAAGQFTQKPTNTGNPKQQPLKGPPVMGTGTMQRGAPQVGRPAAPKSNENYCIVEVGKEYQIVTKPKGVNELKKQVKSKFADAKKAYTAAKKDKNNKGVKIEEPKEKDFIVKEVKSGLKSQEEAQKTLDKLRAGRNKSSTAR